MKYRCNIVYSLVSVAFIKIDGIKRLYKVQSDLIYPDYFVLSNNVGLTSFPDNQNRNYKERNFLQSKCQQRKQR